MSFSPVYQLVYRQFVDLPSYVQRLLEDHFSYYHCIIAWKQFSKIVLFARRSDVFSSNLEASNDQLAPICKNHHTICNTNADKVQ